MIREILSRILPSRGRDVMRVDVSRLPAAAGTLGGTVVPVPMDFNGDKFANGFGPTYELMPDYWTLRARSNQLFRMCLPAKGLINRLITNHITTGLYPEAKPTGSILGRSDDELETWAEDVETRFELWGDDAFSCDYKQQLTTWEMQQQAELAALLCGDVLVHQKENKATRTVSFDLVAGNRVQQPLMVKVRKGHKVIHGVELDRRGRQVAYYIRQDDGKSIRLPAYGEKSGRRLAWLYYGLDHRTGEVRGIPLLGIVLQSLNDIDRYKDSAQRKALVNSYIATWIKKGEDKMGTRPIRAGATKRTDATVQDSGGTTRNLELVNGMPGMMLGELQMGEEPVPFSTHGTDERFSEFEKAILSGIAWANELPPEILFLSFNSNYSASQAAINELKMYLDKVRARVSRGLCRPVYQAWLLNEVLKRNISAPGLLEGWRNPARRIDFNAWTAVDFTGAVKPSTDMKKTAQGYELLIGKAWTTNQKVARETTGTKFTANVRKLAKENKLLVDAMRPLAEFKKEFGEGNDAEVEVDTEAVAEEIKDILAEDTVDNAKD